MAKTKQIAEFGDFQTPLELAKDVCSLLQKHKLKPATIIEPTCGTGSFLEAALERFPGVSEVHGFDINADYVRDARGRLPGKAKLEVADFFSTDWLSLLGSCPEPVLVVGNPPWVTNAELGSLNSTNLPEKSNFQNHQGLDAITGKSNFDISEWMLMKLIEWLDGRRATVAMLCKTAVARKVLEHSWKHGMRAKSELRLIDARRHFGAAVDACLLICNLSSNARNCDCKVYESLRSVSESHTFGCRDGRLCANVDVYEQCKHLEGESVYRWRSGIKHDCSKVMEFIREGPLYRNGLGEAVELEVDYLYPMLKSSELANGHTKKPKRWMLVTQQSVGQDTAPIQERAPKTWNYLLDHGAFLDKRGSSIYKNRPRFSVFGVGPYSLSPWKVAISGFYKRLAFTSVGSREGKPIVLDDTSYLISCKTKQEADLLTSLLTSDTAQQFFSAHIFWDAKRPITLATLSRLDLEALAKQLGKERQFNRHCGGDDSRPSPDHSRHRLGR